MGHVLVSGLLLLTVMGCDSGGARSRNSPNSNPGIGYETFATGLAVPWDLAFATDGRIFVTERPGRIRIIERGHLQAEPWATLDVAAAGEAGLMGIALSPAFETDKQVFVVGTFLEQGRILNRVIRFSEENARGINPTVIVDGIPAAEFHAGDAIEFGPDGKLYVATGDAGVPDDARNPQSLAGKILRYNADGTIPADNPFPNSPVYALGVRNVQGLAWHPQSGALFASEHGPSGFPSEGLRRNNDELNVILPGKNYGWPEIAGNQAAPGMIAPIAVWNPGIAPSGLAIYNGPIDAWKYNIFVGGLRGQQLRRVVIEPRTDSPTGYRVVHNQALFKEDLGRIRAVVMGPDGYLYFTTSNWDGRGDPGPQDDRILRLVPR